MRQGTKRKSKIAASAKRARRGFVGWARAVGIVWAVQIGVLIYFLLTQTWSTYWFCRDLYKPGYTLFAWLGRDILPSTCFNLLSRPGVLISFSAAALLYAAATVLATDLLRTAARKP